MRTTLSIEKLFKHSLVSAYPFDEAAGESGERCADIVVLHLRDTLRFRISRFLVLLQ